MLRIFLALGVSIMLVGTATYGAEPNAKIPPALAFKMKAIDGQEVDLSKYQGRAVLFVNVASECGFTDQYAPLQALHKKYSGQGLSIVGVPCNQFGGQEPGTEKQIAEFCKSNYGVQFDMLSKVDCNGDQACSLYKYLTAQNTKPKGAGEVGWNFEKFLLDRQGNVVARFEADATPDSPDMIRAIETALKK